MSLSILHNIVLDVSNEFHIVGTDLILNCNKPWKCSLLHTMGLLPNYALQYKNAHMKVSSS